MTSQPLTSTCQPQSLEEKLTPKHLAYLVETLYDVTDKCQALGLQLGVDKGTLRRIEKEHKAHGDQLCEILDTLLRQASLTMQNIVQALERKSVGEKGLASQIVRQFTQQSSVTSSQQVTGANTFATPPSTHHPAFQPTLQPNITTPKTQPRPPSSEDCEISHVPIHVGNTCSKPTQHSSLNPPPNPPTSVPSQPQAETAQPPSSSQPSSSQLMSVPVTSQPMPGPSPQLSQDVAVPHPLQVGGQQALQGQPPLQHVPSCQPQSVALSHGTGSASDPPQAKGVRYDSSVAQSHGTGSQSLSSQSEREPIATSLPIPPQAAHLPLQGLQPTPSLQWANQPVTTPISTADQQSTAQHVQTEPVAPHPHIPQQPWAGGDMPTPHMSPITQYPPGSPQLHSQHPLPYGLLSSNWNTAPPLTISTHNPPRPHSPHQPPSLSTASSFGQLMSQPSRGWDVPRPHPSPAWPHVNQPSPNVWLSCGQGMVSPHHPWTGQQVIQGQPQLQHISSHEPQANRPYYESPMAQYIDYVRTRYEEIVMNEFCVGQWPPTPSTVYINLVCVDRSIHVSKQEADECTRAMVEDGNVDVVLRKKTPINFSDIAKNVPASEQSKRRVILVEGAPGVGKSTLAWKFCRGWEEGEIAQQYKLVLLLRLRDKVIHEAQSLADLLYHPSKAVVQAVEDELIATLGANTLIILEGFDELPSTCRTKSSVFLRLINGELLPHATVLVTSRPWATQDLHRQCSHHIFQHIEILGFTGKQIEEYVTSVFTDEGNTVNDKARENIEEVMSYIRTYPQINACMYIPLNSAIVVCVYQESKAGRCILPKTLTELYSALTQTLLLRYLYRHPEYGQRRWNIQSLKEDLPPDVYSKLLAISELAYSGISTDQEGGVQLIFTNQHLPPGFETLGLMQSVPQLYVTQGEDMSHNFLHLTIQEFLAALHISNMSPEKQLEHFQRQKGGKVWEKRKCWKEGGRWRVVLRFLAGLTKLDNLSPEDLRDLLHELKKPNEDHITACRWDVYPATPNVGLSGELLNLMFETQRDDIVPSVLQERIVDFICEGGLTLLDYYSLGYCIVHSHSQWVLTIEDKKIGKEEVRTLVAGASTRCDTSARVVWLRGEYVGGHCPLLISAEALNVLFGETKNIIRLQELHLKLPAECCSITWPNLSGLRVLHLAISGERNWRLDTLLPHLSLESLTIETASNDDTVVFEDCVAIGMLLSSSNCLKCLHFLWIDYCLAIAPQGMEPITKAMSENEYLPLRSVVMDCDCTFSDTAAHSLAVFIRKSTTLHHLSIEQCTFSAHGLLELAQAIHHSFSLQERELEFLTCRVDGDDEVTYCAQLLHHYPHMVDWLYWEEGNGIRWSHISDRGAEAIATALHHNSTLEELDLYNSRISDAGSTALAQALHHNSTLRRLDLSNNNISNAGSMALAQALHHNSTLRKLNLFGNDVISAEGTSQLVQALTVNKTVTLFLPWGCWQYAIQCPQYIEMKDRIMFR